MANRRINWGGVLGIFFNQITFVITVIGGLGFAFISSEIEDDRRDAANAEFIDNMTGDNSEDRLYELSSHSIVRVNETIDDRQITTAYNFRDQVVVIDGPDEADRIIQFSEFDNKAAIDRALEIGCRISTNAPDLLSTFQQEHDGVHPKAETLLSYSASFRQQYCLTQG